MYRRLTLLVVCVIFAAINLCAQTKTPAAQSWQASSKPESSSPGAPVALPSPAPSEEDWTTIDLAKSGLRLDAIKGILLSKVQLQGCTRELLRFQWRRNDPIDLYVIRPGSTEKPPVVLFLYNYTYDTDVFREDRWCDVARKNGFAVAGLASALSWPRLHAPRPMKEWFVSELQEALAESTHDVQMVLNYLATRDDLNVKHVGIFGQGSGGAVAILAAAADSRIGALDLMDPWGDWPDWLKASQQIPEAERAAYLKPEFLGRVSGLDPVVFLPRLKEKALRIQQVDTDPVTPIAARDKIADVAPRPGDISRYRDSAAEKKALGADGIVGWFGEQLKPETVTAHPNRERSDPR